MSLPTYLPSKFITRHPIPLKKNVGEPAGKQKKWLISTIHNLLTSSFRRLLSSLQCIWTE